MAGTVAWSTGVDRRRLDSYALVLAVAGAGRYADELGNTCPIEPGHVIILFPRLRHTYGPARGERWDEIYALFDGPAFDLLERIHVLDRKRPVVQLHPFEPVVSELVELGDAPRPMDERGRMMEVCTYLRLLTGIVVRGAPEPGWLERAKRSLSSGLDRKLDASSAALEAGMRYESFRKRFKLATGVSPIEFRNSRKLAASRELLSSTSLTIKQIAANLGYYDEYHFSRRFRAAVGSAPGAFRRRVQGRGRAGSGQEIEQAVVLSR